MKADNVELAHDLLKVLKALRDVEAKSTDTHGNMSVTFGVPGTRSEFTAYLEGYPKSEGTLVKGNAPLLQGFLMVTISSVIARLRGIGVEP